MADYDLELPASTAPGDVFAAVARAAELWGASFTPTAADGGVLRLTVSAGLRRGVVEGPVEIVEQEDGSRLRFAVERGDYRLHRASLILLLLAGAGALITLAWPLLAHWHPGLLAIAPIAAMLAVGGWFVIAANQKGLGVEEFMALVREELELSPTELERIEKQEE